MWAPSPIPVLQPWPQLSDLCNCARPWGLLAIVSRCPFCLGVELKGSHGPRAGHSSAQIPEAPGVAATSSSFGAMLQTFES